jgi:hypothetical protein
MKKYLALGILTIILFGTLTISTAKIETPFDGNNTYGFPLTFLIRLGGKRFPNPENWTEIFYFKLLVDIAVAFGSGFCLKLEHHKLLISNEFNMIHISVK